MHDVDFSQIDAFVCDTKIDKMMSDPFLKIKWSAGAAFVSLLYQFVSNPIRQKRMCMGLNRQVAVNLNRSLCHGKVKKVGLCL